MKKIILFIILFFWFFNISKGAEIQLTKITNDINRCLLLHWDNYNQNWNSNSKYLCNNSSWGNWIFDSLSIFDINWWYLTWFINSFLYWDWNITNKNINVIDFWNNNYLINYYFNWCLNIYYCNSYDHINNYFYNWVSNELIYISTQTNENSIWWIRNINWYNNICVSGEWSNNNWCVNELWELSSTESKPTNTFSLNSRTNNFNKYYYPNADELHSWKYWTLWWVAGWVDYYLFNWITVEEWITWPNGNISFFNQLYWTYWTWTVRTLWLDWIYNWWIFFQSWWVVAWYLSGQTLNYFNINWVDISINNVTLNWTMYKAWTWFYLTYLKNNWYISVNWDLSLFWSWTIQEWWEWWSWTWWLSWTWSEALLWFLRFDLKFWTAKINSWWLSSNCYPIDSSWSLNYISDKGHLRLIYNPNFKPVWDWSFTILSVDLGRWLSDTINSVLMDSINYFLNFLNLIFWLLIDPLLSTITTFELWHNYCFFNTNLKILWRPEYSAIYHEQITWNTNFDWLIISLCLISILIYIFNKQK